MKDSKSSLLLYLLYKYFFSFMIVITILSTAKEFIQNKISFDTIDNRDFHITISFLILLFVLQIIAYRYIHRAIINKDLIRLNNGIIITWDNIQYINRLHDIYILKTKDKKRIYLFPSEKQAIPILGIKIEHTDMDQLIDLKTIK